VRKMLKKKKKENQSLQWQISMSIDNDYPVGIGWDITVSMWQLNANTVKRCAIDIILITIFILYFCTHR